MSSQSSRIRLSTLACATLFLVSLVGLCQSVRAAARKEKTVPTLRWAEGQPGCTFSRDPDGKYRYALWTEDYGVIVALDSQELQLLHKRIEPFFSVHLTVRYRGKQTLGVYPQRATLEFVKHFKLVQPALDPASFAQQTQDDADELEHQTQREIQKHPERREQREKLVEAYQKEAAEFVEFLNTRSFPVAELDSTRPEASGWILFSAKSKWLGGWKKPEEFVLRIPINETLLEFPFALPPQAGDLILRQR
jgi:hypothetical protein